MALLKWLETDDLSNQNISSATVIGSYTATADKLVMVDFVVNQVAGGGDYTAYITKTVGSVEYTILPKSTLTAAAGETAIGGQSGWILVRNGDVIKVYIDGLAGDTSTPDSSVRFFEGALADGAITATVVATGAIDADAIATDAVTEIQNGLATAANQTTLLARIGAFTGSGVNTILGFLKAIAQKAANTPSDIGGTFSAGTDSLEAIADKLEQSSTIVDNVTSGSITKYRGDYWSIALSGMGDLTDYVSLDFMIKRSLGDADTASLLWVRKNASGTGDGLKYVNGAIVAAPYSSNDGSLTPGTPLSGGTATLVVKAVVTKDLSAEDNLYYEVQAIFTAGPATRLRGIFNIAGDVVRAVS
jgi:hypothetical protein